MLVEVFLLSCFTVAYIVRVLLFDDTVGPFQSKTIFIADGVGDGTCADPADLWDRVRYLFGAYRVEDTENGTIRIWHTTERINLWRCPKCLSFWVAFLVSVPFIIYYDLYVSGLLIHLSITFIAQFLVFLQLKLEE